MKILFSLFLSICFSLILFSSPEWADAAINKVSHLKVAILDAKDISDGKKLKPFGRSRIYQLVIPEILYQDIRKIPGLLVVEPDQLKRKIQTKDLSYGIRNASKKIAVAFGVDLVVQVKFSLLEGDQIELGWVAFWPSDKKQKAFQKLKGPEKKILSMLDDLTFALAETLDRPLPKKAKKWIRRNDKVVIEALYRYGQGLDLYYKRSLSSMVLAREKFKKAEDFDILFLPPYLARAKVEMFLAKKNVEEKDKLLELAYESLRKALFSNEYLLEGYELLAEVYFKRGDPVGAVREGLRALRLNPLSIQARIPMAQAYQAMGKQEEAERELKKILEIDPGNVPARQLLGSKN